MNMDKLLPWLKATDFTVPMKIQTLTKQDVPEKPGVYIMFSDKTGYLYPWSADRGKSRVYYIGQSANLRSRLGETHRKFAIEARSSPDPKYRYYYPRYEYAAYHGCNVCWKTCRDEKAARKSEHDLLVDFASYYGAKPVANGQSAWE